jgi:hypothetical protein
MVHQRKSDEVLLDKNAGVLLDKNAGWRGLAIDDRRPGGLLGSPGGPHGQHDPVALVVQVSGLCGWYLGMHFGQRSNSCCAPGGQVAQVQQYAVVKDCPTTRTANNRHLQLAGVRRPSTLLKRTCWLYAPRIGLL